MPNIRHVVMYGPPFSLVELCQQAGRAGRDGNPATSTIFYCNADLTTETPAVDTSMVQFIRDSDSVCLRKMSLGHLGEEYTLAPVEGAQCCSWCDPVDMDVDMATTANPEPGGSNQRQRRMPNVAAELKEKIRKKMIVLRMRIGAALQEGALVHGIEAAVFGDEAVEKVVRGTNLITTGSDVANLCDGMIQLYADEVAVEVCKAKAEHAAERLEKKAVNKATQKAQKDVQKAQKAADGALRKGRKRKKAEFQIELRSTETAPSIAIPRLS